MRGLRMFGLILIVGGFIGCTTNITPPSGPVGTEVCFDPAPITLFQLGGDEIYPCGWFVDFESEDDAICGYTYETCIQIPSDPPYFSPGEEILITITGDTGYGLFKCGFIDFFDDTDWVPGFKLYGSFLVTE